MAMYLQGTLKELTCVAYFSLNEWKKLQVSEARKCGTNKVFIEEWMWSIYQEFMNNWI